MSSSPFNSLATMERLQRCGAPGYAEQTMEQLVHNQKPPEVSVYDWFTFAKLLGLGFARSPRPEAWGAISGREIAIFAGEIWDRISAEVMASQLEIDPATGAVVAPEDPE